MAAADEMEELEVLPVETQTSPRRSTSRQTQQVATPPVASSSRLKISPTTHQPPRGHPYSTAYRSPPIPTTPSTSASFSPSRFNASPTVSPGVRGFSITPTNTFRPRFSNSVTPTARLAPRPGSGASTSHDIIDFTDDDDDDDGWGGEAVLQWDGVDLTADSASSVAPGDAGLDSEDLETDDDEWGREAVLEFDWNGDGGVESSAVGSEVEVGEDDGSQSSEEEEEELEEEMEEDTVETPRRSKGGVAVGQKAGESLEDLKKRGMPDYESWELKKLQRLCSGYGYRPSTQHKALEKIATDCWKALNPAPSPVVPVTPKPAAKGKSRTNSRQASVSSDDVPLSAKKAEAKGKAKAKGKQKAEDEEVIPIEKRFAAMIKGDAELYLRILQYAPISFDEFVAKCIRACIDDKGWKIALKKFLDFEGITFYTEDPTGQRRSRH